VAQYGNHNKKEGRSFSEEVIIGRKENDSKESNTG
jgi:hypothetical protein